MDINSIIAQGAQPSVQLINPMDAQMKALSMRDLIQQSQIRGQQQAQAQQQQQLAMNQQIHLSQLASDPSNIDKDTGGFTQDALAKIPYLDVRQKLTAQRNATLLEKQKLEEQTDKTATEREKSQSEIIQGIAEDAQSVYEKNRGNVPLATQQMKAHLKEQLAELKKSGRGQFAPEQLDSIGNKMLAMSNDDFFKTIISHRDKMSATKDEDSFTKEQKLLSKLESDYSDLTPGTPEAKSLATRIGGLKQHLAKLDAPSAAQQSNAPGNSLTPEGRDLYDDLALRDGSFMSRMGVKNITERNKTINDWAKAGKTADDVISARIGMKMDTREGQSLAVQKAGLERVERAISMKGGIADQVSKAALEIDPSKFRAYNKVSQFINSEQSDPKLAAYKLKLIALRDEFATVINKGGQPTEGSRKQASEMMDQYGPTAIPAIVQAIKDVVKTNQAAIDDSMAGVGRKPKESESEKPKGNISTALLNDYATKHKMTPEAAAAFLKSQGYDIK
jgi:hypothetical protein